MPKQFVILSDTLGSGDDDLGRLLMRNFLYSLARAETRPAAVSLGNSAVRLACTGSDSLDDLKLLAEAGVPVRSCGTCLDFLHLKEDLAVGGVGTMPDMVDMLVSDADVVTLG